MAMYWSHYVLFFVVSVGLIAKVRGAPLNHHNPHQGKTSSRSYIDIDASDPFKVPKSSHYIDKTMPDFDKEEEAEARAEKNAQKENAPVIEEENSEQQQAPIEDNSMVNPPNEEESNGENGQNLNELSPSFTDKINELAENKGSNNGSPIEINEGDLQKLLHKDSEGAPNQGQE